MPVTTGFLLHPAAADHDTGPGHPERSARIEAIRSAVEAEMPGLAGRVEQVAPSLADPAELLRVHPAEHLEQVRAAVAMAGQVGQPVEFAPETIVSAASWEAILGALGGVLEAVTRVADGRWQNAFVAARPPGHHCSARVPMGFCPVNTVAVVARHLLEEGAAERVLIVDWDVHHGNGTQDIFWSDPEVFYLSLHQSPWYPGTGGAQEIGEGAGRGTTLNVPLAAGTRGRSWLDALAGALGRVEADFAPDVVLVSSGFDALAADPLGGFELEPSDFHAATRILMGYAERACGGRVVALLEGGYAVRETAHATVEVLRALAGLDVSDSTSSRSTNPLLTG